MQCLGVILRWWELFWHGITDQLTILLEMGQNQASSQALLREDKTASL